MIRIQLILTLQDQEAKSPILKRVSSLDTCNHKYIEYYIQLKALHWSLVCICLKILQGNQVLENKLNIEQRLNESSRLLCTTTAVFLFPKLHAVMIRDGNGVGIVVSCKQIGLKWPIADFETDFEPISGIDLQNPSNYYISSYIFLLIYGIFYVCKCLMASMHIIFMEN